MPRRTELKISLFSFQDIITSVTGVMILLTLLLALELVESAQQSPALQTTELVNDLQEQIAVASAELEDLKKRINASSTELSQSTTTDKDAIKREIQELQKKIAEMNLNQDNLNKKKDNLTKTKKKLEVTKQSLKEMEEERKKIEDEIKNANERLFKVGDGVMVLVEPRKNDRRDPWIVEFFGSKIMVSSVGTTVRQDTFSRVSLFQNWLKNKKPREVYFYLLVHEDGIQDFRQVKEDLLNKGYDYGIDLLLPNQTAMDSQQGASK
jgi:flagellar motility protein MotE (MotC chaperone)